MKHELHPPFGRLVRRAGRVLCAFGLAFAAASARAEVVTEALVNPGNPDDVWGQKISGLGDNGDEVALVFTKTGETLNWTPESTYQNVRFLVVGGGGSGGSTPGAGGSAGGGGGAGGMATGVVSVVSAGMPVSITVGKGGAYSTSKTAGDHGESGGDSKISVGDTAYVIAKGGGYGGGYPNSTATVGGSGGSAGAAGGNKANTAVAVGTAKSLVDYDTALNLLNAACGVSGEVLGHNAGGKSSSAVHGSGGGGAGAAGAAGPSSITTGQSSSGVGGDGVVSDITGEEIYYAGGGGGGAADNTSSATSAAGVKWGALGGKGGGGQGGSSNKSSSYGGSLSGANGTANTGGGGGGAGYWSSAHGGNGGSGIVVIRYQLPSDDEASVPFVDGKIYNGDLQTADVSDGKGYYVTENKGGVDAGDYVVTLALSNGFHWVGGSQLPTNLTFTIRKAANEWQRAPSLSKDEWQYLDEAATVDFGLALTGEAATVAYDGDSTEMPVTVGAHTAVFTVAESTNYKAISKTIPYTVKPRTNKWVRDPSITPDTWAFDEQAGEVSLGEAESGVQAAVTYDESLTEMPTDLGAHTAVFTVAASENYTALEKTVSFEITKKVNGWTSAPVVEPTRYTPGALPTFTPPTARFGDVVRYFDGDPANTEVPTSLGKHTVTYAVAEGDDYQAFEQTIELTVIDRAALGVAQVVIDGYDGAETLTNFPALVRFSADNIEGLNADLLSEDGGDVRVYGEDGNELAFEIESWDRTGESIIWVKIPELAPTSEKITSVFVKWGATEARTTDPKDVWTEYLAVWHMNDTTIADATGNGNVLTGTSVALTDGEVGKALAASMGLAMSANFVDDCPDYAVSCWYRYGSAVQVSPLSKGGWQKNGWYLEYKGTTTEMNYIVYSTKSSVVAPDILDNWNHVSVNVVGGALTGYMNGTTKNTHTKTVSVDDYKLSVLGSNGSGKIDELRIHKGGESAAWAKADYRAQTGALVSYALVQNPQLENVIVAPSETAPFVDNERNLTIGYRVASTGGSTVKVSALYAIEGADTTNETVIGTSSVVQTEDVFGTVEDLMPGTNYLVAVYGKNASGGTSEPTAFQQVTVPGPVAIADLEFSQTKDAATITGVITGLGTKTAKLKYAFGADEFAEIDLVLGDDGAFSVTLDRTSATDTLKYQVVADNTLSTTTWGDFAWNAETKIETSTDGAPVTYTWSGAVSDEWADPANWEASIESSYGFPNSSKYATAMFTQPATVDLGGGTFGLVAEGLKFSANLGEVTLTNGTISVPFNDFGYGASGTTVIFDHVTISGQKGLKFVKGATVVFKGSASQGWQYEPWNPGGKTELKFVDGEISSGCFQVWLKDTDDHRITIDNAVWTLAKSSKVPGQLAKVFTLLDGVDRQAQFVNQNDSLSLAGIWHITIPANGHAEASIIGNAAQAAGGTFELEVKDWTRSKRVPLVKYTGADQSSTIEDLLARQVLKLSVLVDGEPESDVKAAHRNGRFEWDAESNTLYYKQNARGGFALIVK